MKRDFPGLRRFDHGGQFIRAGICGISQLNASDNHVKYLAVAERRINDRFWRKAFSAIV